MLDLPEQIDFVVQPQDALDVVFEHIFVDSLQCELPPVVDVFHLVHLCEVAFTNDGPDFVIALQILVDAEVLDVREPLLDVLGRLGLAVLDISQHGVTNGKQKAFVHVFNHDALVQIMRSADVAVLAVLDHRLGWLLDRDQVHLTVLQIQNLALGVSGVVAFKFVEFALEENEESLLGGLQAVLVDRVLVLDLPEVLEELGILLRLEEHFLDVEVAFKHGPGAHLHAWILVVRLGRRSGDGHWREARLLKRLTTLSEG